MQFFTMAPMTAFLTNLGSETLHLRMERHSENALKVAKYLQTNPNVEWVRYPGLEDNEQHAKAVKYYLGKGFGGMMTFGVKGGRSAANQVMKNLKLAKIVTHVADARTCVLHPASTTHRQLSDQQLIDCGIKDNLIRLSVGIENADDIIADLEQALNI